MELVSERLLAAEVGNLLIHGPLTVAPLLGDDLADRDYLTLDEALESRRVEITEIHGRGNMGQLKLRNTGTSPVFLMDGEELVGAKQNRVLNLSMVVPGRQTVTLPVSCVEVGRWSRKSAGFSSSPNVLFCSSRATKAREVSLSSQLGGRQSDQCGMWSRIRTAASKMGTRSGTMAMSDIFDQRSEEVEAFVRAIPCFEGQVGAIFSVNGCVTGMDMFDCAATFALLRPKLVRSYALDALAAGSSDYDEDDCRGQMLDFLHNVASAETASFPGVGLGNDIRLEGPGVAGGALEYDRRLLHLCAFHLPGARQPVGAPVRALLIDPPMGRTREEELLLV